MTSLALAILCGCAVACTCRGTASHRRTLGPVAASVGATLLLSVQAGCLAELLPAARCTLASVGSALVIASLFANYRLLAPDPRHRRAGRTNR